ncbi:serine hydrolase domain-containing protein [uncultured Jannaschia sp.]|uniref:serine hydrolase domain-containing protein n=1 Tax=uncultured Jannaschia sp. TaxID=293347 RepID=UPI00260EDFA9|nr:serine hydrolase domain-containing protein [uncultured Jannaschia sp.]
MHVPKMIMGAASVAAIAALLATGAAADEWRRVAPEAVGMSAERLQRLTDAMQGYVDDGDVAGIVLLIARDGKVPYFESFGARDLASGSPMEEDTIFRIASQTKAIISAGAMLLQEEGLLLVEDPVGKYLPEWMSTIVGVPNDTGGFDVVPAERPITIRDLLTHTSGVPYGSWQNGVTDAAWDAAGIPGWYFASDDEPIRDIVRRMASLPMLAQPGTKWAYGNNIDVLGALIEEISGQPLDAFLRDRFFEPLGMDDTYFFLPEDKADRLATVYDRAEDGTLTPAAEAGAMGDQGDYVVGHGPNVTFSGGAGLLSTAHDYSVFLEMIRNGGVTMDGDRILSPMSTTLMTTDHTGDIAFRPGAGFGYGFQVATDQGALGIPGHDGEFRWGGAYHSTYWVDPEAEMVVTYFTQFGETGGLDDQAKLRALIYQAIVN